MTGTEDELEALLQFLYAAPVGLLRTGADGTIEMANAAAARMLLPVAAQPARLLNLFDSLDGVAPGLRDVVQASTARSGALLLDRSLVLAAPGQPAEQALHAVLSLYRMGSGQLMAVLMDTTEAERDQRARHAGEARLRFVLDAAAIGDWALDLDSGRLAVDGAFEACLGQGAPAGGWTLEALMARLHDSCRDAAYAAFDQALATGGDWRVEVQVDLPPPSPLLPLPPGPAAAAPAPGAGPEVASTGRWLLLHGRLHGPAGRGRRMLGMVQDVSARRQAEEARLEARRLADEKRLVEQSARMRADFLARMSHEIRTPLNAIIGLTQVLQRRARDPAELQPLERLDRAGRHLLQLVNDVLDLAKVDAGQMALRSAPFALDALLAGALEMVADAARQKQLPLVLDAQGLPQRVVGDAGRLSQALLNLLANAVRLTAQGHVTLRARSEPAEGGRCRLRFEVEDTGPGIASAQQARLFQPFVQTDGSAPGGTGLGLAVTRQIAQLMGGEVGVHSVPGLGSRFWLSVCLDAVDEPLPAPEALLAGRRVLVVDALPARREALLAQLRQLGLEAQAEDGLAGALAWLALAAAGQRLPAALLLAAGAGAPDGLATLEQLRQHLGASLPPVLLLADGAERVPPEVALLPPPVTGTTLQAALLAVLAAAGRPDMRASTPMPRRRISDSEAQLQARHAGRRVLLVEDNPVNQDVASELLRAAGLQVQVADDGAQAIAHLATGHYDLVLMDMQMPVMDGLEATRLLRERLGARQPVIGFSANAYAVDRSACLAAGMNDHLAKPVEPEALYACLLRWLDAG